MLRVEPRLYQQTIFNTAATKNTLVVLPTGMGKTLIAELLTIHRLQHYPSSKVLVLAPTRPLVEQHARTFKQEADLDGVIFTGSVPPAKRAALWKEASLIFSTPQGLENDLVSRRISLEEVSLIIFDEAHRAVGEYSYIFIAERYRKSATHGRILALTASPGSTKEAIAEVCANLDIEEVEARSADSADVKPYLQEVDVEHISVAMPPAFKQVHRALTACHEQRLHELRRLGVLNSQALANKTTMLKAQASLHARAARGEKSYERLKSMSLLAEALKVQHALELIETQGTTPFANYLAKLHAEAARGQSKAVQHLVRDVNFKEAELLLARVQEEGIEHPKVRVVQQRVLQELYKAPDAKIIIFTQYRDQAVKLHETLTEINVSSRVFVGQLKKGATGMSQKEQRATLDEFRAGRFNVLIATSVAEEGLDIPKVDVVLFYEPVPSAIRTVQRRGRTGRLEKGKVIMLVTEGTRDVGYRWSAHHKERRMQRLLTDVRGELHGREPAKRQRRATSEKTNNITIVADHREKTSGVLKALLDKEVQVELRQLTSGDYLLSDRVVVEYKRVPDFVNSIIDGRLLHQLRALRAARRPLIVIEGEEDLYGVRNVHPNALLGMLGTIAVSYNIPVLFTRTPSETAALFVSIARREATQAPTQEQLHAQKPRTLAEQQRYVVASLPEIGAKNAERLLNHFKTVRALVNASPDELEGVQGIGKKRAKSLHDFFNTPG